MLESEMDILCDQGRKGGEENEISNVYSHQMPLKRVEESEKRETTHPGQNDLLLLLTLSTLLLLLPRRAPGRSRSRRWFSLIQHYLKVVLVFAVALVRSSWLISIRRRRRWRLSLLVSGVEANAVDVGDGGFGDLMDIYRDRRMKGRKEGRVASVYESGKW